MYRDLLFFKISAISNYKQDIFHYLRVFFIDFIFKLSKKRKTFSFSMVKRQREQLEVILMTRFTNMS